MIGGRTGPWVMDYRTEGTGAMLSISPTGWAVSAAVRGRGVVGGWMLARPRGWRDRKFTTKRE